MAEQRLFCTFRLGGASFAVDVLSVKEVNTETACTPVPQAPPEVCGYVNLRGQIHLVLDLRRLLGLGQTQRGPDTRLVIFKPAVGEAFGVLVDSIGDIVGLSAEQVEEGPAAVTDVPDARRLRGELLAGVGKADDGLLLIVRPQLFLKAVEQALST